MDCEILEPPQSDALYLDFNQERSPHPKSNRTFKLGMPQLDASGLSEAWLQKTCGEIHWAGLADELSMPSERWTDSSGRRVYAAFGLLRLQSAHLPAAREGATLEISSQLAPVGRSQAWSQHRLRTAQGAIGVLEMLSVFVCRESEGSNRSVRRVLMRAGSQSPPPNAQQLVDVARARRDQMVPAPASNSHFRPLQLLPCPRSDYNGAGLIYFPSYTAWCDRALFGWGLLGAPDTVEERECLFLGNLDIGNQVEILLQNVMNKESRREVEVHIRCAAQARVLAVIRSKIKLLC